jgi:GxxExxY protein
MKFNDELTAQIIEAVIKVHQTLGPGFIERIYRNALVIELGNRGFDVKTEHSLAISYEGHHVGNHRLDLVINNQVVLELKSVAAVCTAHYAQLRSYLHAAGLKVGLLVNFANEKADFRRVEIS